MYTSTDYKSSAIKTNGSYTASTQDVSQSVLEEGWNLSQFFGIVHRRGILMGGIALAVTSLFWANALNQKPVYRENFQILIDPVTNTDQNSITDSSVTRRSSQNLAFDYITEIQVLKSSRVLQPVVLKVQQQYPSFSYGELAGSLKIDREKSSKIINVQYQNKDALKVSLVLEEVAKEFLQYSKNEKKTSLRQGLKFAESQIEITRERVDLLQQKLEFFRRENNFIDTATQNQKIASQISSLEAKSLSLREEIAETDELYKSLTTSSGIAAALADDVGYQKLVSDVREVDKKISTEATRFQSETLFIQALKEERQNLIPIVRQEAQRIITNEIAKVDNRMGLLEERQKTIQLAELYWKQEEQRLPAVARLHTDLQRELKVATESLNRFLQVREALQVRTSQQEVPWQLIDPPQQPRVRLASTQRSLVLGLISGILAGVAAGWIAERFDNTFHSVDELRKELNFTLLAAVPYYQDADQYHIFLMGEKSKVDTSFSSQFLQFRESFRSLYANLCSLEQGDKIRSIAVSSPRRGDGKTVTAAHLAQSAAAMGRRVLLIDADFRHRTLSQRLNREQEPGFSELLTTSIEPQKVILDCWSTEKNIAPMQKLFFLPAGQFFQDPTSLFASSKMHHLSAYLEDNFDLVIYDTPSLLNVADSMLIAKCATKMILVSAMAQTERSMLLESLERLRISRIPILGLVANGVRARSLKI